MNRALVFALLCFIALCVGIYLSLPHTEISIGSFSSFSLQEESTPEQEPVKSKIRFVGDVMLSRNVEHLMDVYGSMYPFEALPFLPEDSYLVGNFEGSVPKVHVPTKSMEFSFSVEERHVAGLSEYGFTHLGLANNHSYDFGVDDYKHTSEVLSKDFKVFGDQKAPSYESVALIETASSTVAIVGIYAVDAAPEKSEIEEILRYAESMSTHQVVYVHWGTEYALTHSAFQENLAKLLIDVGADAVVGHHPHVVQDIGIYKGSPIFYSLGNFVFDQYFSSEVQMGLMLELSPSETALSFALIPVSSIGSRSQVRVSGQYERDLLLQEIAKKSDPALLEEIQNGYIESAF